MDMIWSELQAFLREPNIGRTVFIVAIAVFIAYWIGELFAKVVIKIAQKIAVRADQTTNEERQLKLRRVETYLGVTVAIIRAAVVGVGAYLAIKLFGSQANAPATAIGASAFFIVLAGSTVGLILRDITAGTTMIVERWFNVGDHIRVEPFLDVGGVVERMTLRSTKLRSLNGEVIWLHNQYMQGVKVTPRGLRTIAVDIFVSSEEAGLKLVNRSIAAIPTGPLMLARPLTINTVETWSNDLVHIEVSGQTAPGREWLIESFFVDSLKQLDERRETSLMVQQPLVRYADPDADRNFKRAVRVAKREQARTKK